MRIGLPVPPFTTNRPERRHHASHNSFLRSVCRTDSWFLFRDCFLSSFGPVASGKTVARLSRFGGTDGGQESNQEICNEEESCKESRSQEEGGQESRSQEESDEEVTGPRGDFEQNQSKGSGWMIPAASFFVLVFSFGFSVFSLGSRCRFEAKLHGEAESARDPAIGHNLSACLC